MAMYIVGNSQKGLWRINSESLSRQSDLHFLHFDYVFDRLEFGQLVGDENAAGKASDLGQQVTAVLSRPFLDENRVALEQSANGIRVAMINALHRSILRETWGGENQKDFLGMLVTN